MMSKERERQSVQEALVEKMLMQRERIQIVFTRLNTAAFITLELAGRGGAYLRTAFI